MEKLTQKLLEQPRLKTVDGKYVTGAMLLALALEYVDAINSNDTPTVNSCFRRVIQAEAHKFTDAVIEEASRDCRQAADEALMPIEEDDLDEAFARVLEGGLAKIALRLYETAPVEDVLDAQLSFEARVSDVQRDLRRRNHALSKKNSYEAGRSLFSAHSLPRVSTFEDIRGSLRTDLLASLGKVVAGFQKEARGPAQGEAFIELVRVNVIEEYEALLQAVQT